MSDTTKTLPEQILEASQAFTKTLELENIVFQNQLDGIVRMAVETQQKLIALCKEAFTIDSGQFAAQHNQAMAALQQASADARQVRANSDKTGEPALPEVPPVGDSKKQDLNAALIESVGMSYKNAVAAQQQGYITQQAATTTVITTLMSLTTPTIAMAVQAELQKISA